MKKLLSLGFAATLLTGCTTTKTTSGSTTQLDPQAVAVIIDAVHVALNEPAVSNAIFNATAPKAK